MSISRPERKLLLTISVILAVISGACNYPAQDEAPVAAADAGIAGRLWHDICASPGSDQPRPDTAPPGCILGVEEDHYIANGRLDQNEGGLGGVEVSLGQGVCPSYGFASTTTEQDGLYLFASLSPGIYCVSIDPANNINAGILLPGRWTYPQSEQPEGVASMQVELEQEEIQADVYFAWDYELLPPYEVPATTSPPTATSNPDEATPTITATPENTPTLTVTPSPEISPSPTLSAEDPRSSLKNPTWGDGFENQSDWALYSDTHASFEIVEDGLEMKAFNPDFFNSWVLSWRKAEDLYLEATGTFSDCSGRDAYGLMVRSTGGNSGYVGYLFGISCDGRYSLRSWNGESMGNIVGWTADESINSGSGQSNRVGIWADGSKLSLYANGEFLVQVNDTAHPAEGLFGLFVSSAQTENFTTTVNEISFWNLD